MPPTIAAAKIGSMMLKDRSGFSVTSSASSVPPAAASAPAMIQVVRTTEFGADARDAREIGIVGHGAHRLAHARAGEEEMQRHDGQRR